MSRSYLHKATKPIFESGRLNRYIARAGICSRRNADRLIEQGEVCVNGKVTHEYWYQVEKGDKVTVNGKTISPSPFLYLLLNKPKDTITTVKDEKGRKTVMDLIHMDQGIDGLFPVGRLDRATSGVLLLTSDGDLGHRLMHPKFEVSKQYRVRTKDPIRPNQIDQLLRGIVLEDGVTMCDQVVYLTKGNPRELGIELHEGRNRQIRRMLEALGHEINSLDRISYAGLTARGLRRGQWRELSRKEIKSLFRKVGHHRRS